MAPTDIDFIAAERDLLEERCWALEDSRRNLREALRAVMRCAGPGMHSSMASIAATAIGADNEDTPPAYPLISQDDARGMLRALTGLIELRDNTSADEFEAYQAMFKSAGAEAWAAAEQAVARIEAA